MIFLIVLSMHKLKTKITLLLKINEFNERRVGCIFVNN